VDVWFDAAPDLEIRLWVARELRPSDGFESYFFNLDPEFVSRVDGNWIQLYHMLNRKFLKHKAVTVTNL
jgi:hypothetical protein